jgi:hypothetical protein
MDTMADKLTANGQEFYALIARPELDPGVAQRTVNPDHIQGLWRASDAGWHKTELTPHLSGDDRSAARVERFGVDPDQPGTVDLRAGFNPDTKPLRVPSHQVYLIGLVVQPVQAPGKTVGADDTGNLPARIISAL